MMTWAKKVVFGGFLAVSTFASGEILRSFDADRHDRFLGFPSDLTENSGFFLGGEDWSSVGWSLSDTRRHFTLVSPKHFLCARHFAPSVGQMVRFVSTTGVSRDYQIEARFNVFNDQTPATATDLMLCELTERVADDISYAPVYNLASIPSSYQNQEYVLSGRFSRAGVATVGGASGFLPSGFGNFTGGGINQTFGMVTRFEVSGTVDDVRLQVGDSGGPTFSNTATGLALVGIHTAIASVTEPEGTVHLAIDTFVPFYIDDLDTLMESEGYHITRWDGDEPTLELSLTESDDPVLSDAGVTYTVTIDNVTNREDARNLRVDLSLDAGATFVSASGTGLVVENNGNTMQVRQAMLTGNDSITFSVVVDLPAEPAQAINFSVSAEADGSNVVAASETTDVIGSYADWASELVDSSSLGDEDGDGVANRIEYMLGRDGGIAEEDPPLLVGPAITGPELVFVRRTLLDSNSALLEVEESTDLINWTIVPESSLTTAAAGFGFEEVSLGLDFSEEKTFYRLVLDES